MQDAIKFIGGWIAIFVLVIVLIQSGWGRAITYYLLWLMVVLVLVTSGPEIATLLGGATGTAALAGTPLSGAKQPTHQAPIY